MKSFGMDKNLVTYPLLEAFAGVKAFTTHRQTFPGVDAPRFTGEPVQKIRKNREMLAHVLGIGPEQLVFPRQTHTSCIVELYGLPEEELENTDALATNQPGICLCVQTADCVPILLFDPKGKAISAIHAGWRGTVKQIAREAVRKLSATYRSSPADIRAVIGPSIGPDVYEVGDEVVKAVFAKIPNAPKTLSKNSSGKFHFNLWEANRQILMDCGLLPQNIEISGQCTFHKKDYYFSARRDGIQTGRLVTGIMLEQSL